MVLKLRIAFTAGVLLACCPAGAQSPPQKIAINYPTRTGQIWPLYIAKEGGYYQKYGYDVSLVFGVHPAGIAMIVSGEAAMTAYTLEQAMIASSKDGSLVALGSPYKKSLFALMAGKNITSIRESERQAHRREPDRRRAVQLQHWPCSARRA